jgi:predicted permease
MQSFWQDLRFGARMLLKNSGFTLIAVMTLALGIGANTAIFSLTDQILLRRLPVQRPEELVVLRSPGPKTGSTTSDGDGDASFSYPLYKALRDRGNDVFAGLLARFPIPLSVAGAGQTERADGELVSGNYFEVLGARPALGRVFNQEDDRAPGAHPVVVLSHAYWTRRFGADPAILNKTLTVNGNSMTVIGVSREGFRGVQVGQTPDVFIPIMMKAQMTPNWNGLEDHKDHWLAIIGRLKPGMSRAQAEETVRPSYRAILEEELPLMTGFKVETRQRFLDKRILLDDGSKGRLILQRDTKKPFLILTGMAGLALLIACANVANLLIARGAAARDRRAHGVGRFRVAIDAAVPARKPLAFIDWRSGRIGGGRLGYPGIGRGDPAQCRSAWSFGGTQPALAGIHSRALGSDRACVRSDSGGAGHAAEPRIDFERTGLERFRRIIERALPQGSGGLADLPDNCAAGRSGIVRPQSQ